MTLNNAYTEKRTQFIPRDSAAHHLGVLLRGYLSTRTVMASEAASETPLMLRAENAELYHAALGTAVVDHSLPPRRVAVTLLAYGKNPSFCNAARGLLDGLAYLANTPLAPGGDDDTLSANVIRMTVLAGTDAEWFSREVQSQALDTKPGSDSDPSGGVDVCVRWALAGESAQFRSEFKSMHTGLSADKSLEAMQNCFLSMKIAYGAPFPPSIANAHPNVPVDAWAKSVHHASKAFFELMEGKPCVYKSDVLKKYESEVSMESTGIFVRICPRKAHDPTSNTWVPIAADHAKTRPDAFHAFLVGNSRHSQDITNHCKIHERTGLPPMDEDTAGFCLHTCAVQAHAFHMHQRVSLYATHHKAGGLLPGQSICPPGSWVWRMEPAIVAIEHVLQEFYVLPCSRDSVLPGDRKLERPFNEFFNRAYKLYTNTFGAGIDPETNDDFERLPLSLPLEGSGPDPSVRAAEEYALTAFQLDASNRRIVAGDAYAALYAQNAPLELTNFMLQSSLHMGINTPILQVISTAADAVAAMSCSDAKQKALEVEVDRLKRVADGALGVSLKRHRALAPVTIIDTGKVKSLLAAAGLRKGLDSHLPTGKDVTPFDYSSVVQTISSCVISGPITEVEVVNACAVAHKARSMGALGCVTTIACALRGSRQVIPGSLFLLTQQADADANNVSFNLLLPGGAVVPTTPGKIIDSPKRSVLLLKMSGDGGRLTATVSS